MVAHAKPKQGKDIRSLRSIARKIVHEFRGVSSADQLRKELRDALNEEELNFYIDDALLTTVQAEIHLAGIEKEPVKRFEQGEMFSDSYLDRVLTIEGGQVLHLRDTQWQHHMELRERQIKNLRQSNTKFEIDEQRRDVLRQFMEGTNKTTEQAVWSLQT